jgi:hypothetical protein
MNIILKSNILPFALFLSLIWSNSLKSDAQYSQRINIFLSTNDNGRDYDILKTKGQRDSLIQIKLNEDWVNTILGKANTWSCANYASQLRLNFYGDTILSYYNGYEGFNLDSLDLNQGTYKDNGKYGLPVFYVSISYDKSEFGHAMNAILTGDDALNWYDWNFIEPQRDQENVQPGQAYMPGIFANDTVDGYLAITSPKGVLVEYRIKNGIPELIYDDQIDYGVPHPLLIKIRDSLNPSIMISSPIEGQIYNTNPNLNFIFSDSTLKEACYSLDGGVTKNVLYRDLYEYKVIGQKYCGPPDCTIGYWYDAYKYVHVNTPSNTPFGSKTLILPDGDYKLSISVKDYFNHESSEEIKFTIDKTVPEINISSPSEGSLSHENNINLNYILRDKNLDLKNSYFKLNGIANYFSDSTGTILLDSKEGLNKLEIHAEDLIANSSDKAITYYLNLIDAINNPEGNPLLKFYPNPVINYGIFEFENNDKREVFIELYDIQGNKIGQRSCKENRIVINFSQYSSGIINYKLFDLKGLVSSGIIVLAP